MRTFRAVAAVCVLALLLVSLPAAAGDDRISRGDVQKTFQTFPDTSLGRIGFAQDGGVFCPEYWHLLAVGAFIEQSKEGREVLREMEVTILLDGVVAPKTKETGIRSIIPWPSDPNQIFKQWCKFLAPGSLTGGSHSYQFTLVYPPPVGVLVLGPFTFTLSQAACELGASRLGRSPA